MTRLAEVEHAIKGIQRSQRDHVNHSLLVFALGLFISHRYQTRETATIVPLQWKLASLFHDIAYPYEIASNIASDYTNRINQTKNLISGTGRFREATSRTHPIGLERLSDKTNGLDLIQNCINSWDLDIDIKKEYNNKIKTNSICHGMISALTILNIIDYMYHKYNPERINIGSFIGTEALNQRFRFRQPHPEGEK